MFATASLALLLLTPPQEPEQVLATYKQGDERRAVTRIDVALEMAFHLRRRERGRQGCDFLVDSLLVRREANKQGLMPNEAEVRAFASELEKQLRAAGHDPREFAALRNSGEQQWLADLAIQIAQKRLVRAELGLGDDEDVSSDMSKLWLSETRKRADIETDPDKLPAGTAVRVGEQQVPLVELGLLLLRTSEDFERDRYIRQVIYLECAEKLAAQHRVSVSPADLDQGIDRRRRAAQEDPRYRGVSFENLLEAQGLTVDSLRQLRVFRTQLLLEKLAAVLHPDERLREELASDRARVLADIGPKRRIGVIFVRAREKPNALIQRTFEMAQDHLLKVRERIATDGFAATASIESEHGASKRKGGDLGWHRRNDNKLPDVVAKAAFALPLTEVSMPIRGPDGCYLVTVLDREPTPGDDELITRLRKWHQQQLGERLLEHADIEIAGQEPAGGK